MTNPICPACGDEMEYTDHDGLVSYWSCEKEAHTLVGPYDDESGEATRAMIAEIRQEARVAALESELDGAKSTLSHPGTKYLKEDATLGEIAHYYHVLWQQQIHASQNRVIEAEAKADRFEGDLASAIDRCRELTQLLNAERLQSGDELRVKIAGLEEKLAGLEEKGGA